MRTTTILFDLDGTLLPMDQDVFVKTYFGSLAKKLAPLGYDPKKLIDGIWMGTAAMVKNDGSSTNEAVFWDVFSSIFSHDVRKDESYFDAFYRNEFQNAQAVCGFNAKAAPAIRKLKEMGFRVALATNPIFPSVATESRIRWAGLDRSDFELVTTYENSRHCKPNLAYYQDIMNQLDVTPEECMMVGNDVEEDMIAAALGMKVFLMPECLISRTDQDLSIYPQGGFDDLLTYAEQLLIQV